MLRRHEREARRNIAGRGFGEKSVPRIGGLEVDEHGQEEEEDQCSIIISVVPPGSAEEEEDVRECGVPSPHVAVPRGTDEDTEPAPASSERVNPREDLGKRVRCNYLTSPPSFLSATKYFS